MESLDKEYFYVCVMFYNIVVTGESYMKSSFHDFLLLDDTHNAF